MFNSEDLDVQLLKCGLIQLLRDANRFTQVGHPQYDKLVQQYISARCGSAVSCRQAILDLLVCGSSHNTGGCSIADIP